VLQCSLGSWLIRDVHIRGRVGNFGGKKTTELLEERFYYLLLKCDVKKYVGGCEAYQEGKGVHQNIGFYMPFPIPKEPWEHVSMDFIMGLPRKTRNKSNILVVVDSFNKMTHFLPCIEQVDVVKTIELIYERLV